MLVYSLVYQLGLEDQVQFLPVDFSKGENKSDWYLALNPLGQIPTLKDGDFGLGEGTAIQSYILHKTGYHGDFLPSDLKQRARVMQVCSFEQSSLR